MTNMKQGNERKCEYWNFSCLYRLNCNFETAFTLLFNTKFTKVFYCIKNMFSYNLAGLKRYTYPLFTSWIIVTSL